MMMKQVGFLCNNANHLARLADIWAIESAETEQKK